MTVLETAAFAMPANEAAILGIFMPSPAGGGGNGGELLFAHWLTAQLARELPETVSPRRPQVTPVTRANTPMNLSRLNKLRLRLRC